MLLLALLLAAPACKDGTPPAGDPPAPATAVEPGRALDVRSGAASSLIPTREPPLTAEPSAAEAPLVDCPVPSSDVDAVLDEAGGRYDGADFPTALACAELAVDLVPQAVEAQHLRAAALAALGRFEEAQIGFAMALALDPDDPETLAAAADFYINLLPPKRRQTVLVGLEYARRGGARAATRRRLDRALRARLLLLEAEALNDLGAADLALPRVEEALSWAPGMLAAEHERGVSLFNLCRFDDAEEAFLGVLGGAPDDPYAHHHLGLIYERSGRKADADAHFQRARALAPAEFPEPIVLGPAAFEAEVAEAIAELPAETRAQLAEIDLELVDVPAIEDLTAADPPFAPTILGLFRGLPLGVEHDPEQRARPGEAVDTVASAEGRIPPRAIVLYRVNLGRAARTPDELDLQIRRTLLHEIGHLQGLDEDELRRRGLE